MREIKFRAWDKKTKEMPEVSEMIITSSGINYRATGDHAVSGWRGNDLFMQYTGLKDKNGKEIYEGDIVRWSGSLQGEKNIVNEVFWGMDHSFCLKVPNRKPDEEFPDGVQYTHGLPLSHPTEIEVIGNIYESPELLEACHCGITDLVCLQHPPEGLK
jgi:phage uncharacterized protein TIGR01671